MGLVKEKKLKSTGSNVSVFPIFRFDGSPGVFLVLAF